MSATAIKVNRHRWRRRTARIVQGDTGRDIEIYSIEGRDFMERAFTCERGSLTIRGMQFFPADFAEEGNGSDRKYPIVVISHGFTGNYTDMAGYARSFAGIGYMAFCFSFCGGGRSGEPEASRSDGKSTDMTVLTEVEDLLTVIRYAQSLPYTDAGQVVLTGYSQGGFVSGLAAARCGDQAARLIMISPALCIPDHARRGCLGGASYDPRNVPEVIDCGVTALGRAFHEEAAGMDPFLELSAYRGKVLLIQGMADTVVHYSYAVRAQACYQEGQCHLQLIRDQGQGYDERQCAGVFDSIRQFLADSAALAWMNHADLTAVLEGGDGGPTVRIFADGNAGGR